MIKSENGVILSMHTNMLKQFQHTQDILPLSAFTNPNDHNRTQQSH